VISKLNNSNLSIAFDFLKKDPVMSFFISRFGHEINVNERNNSNYAIAILISNKSNKQILKLKNSTIQKVGVSFKKVEYMKNVLSFFVENNLDLENLDQNEIEKKLIKIKGIGKCTIETDENEITKLTHNWSPFRTVASLLLWFSIESNIYYDSNIKS